MTLKSFVANQVRAVSLKNDLALVHDESFPFQRRVAVHVAKRLAQLDVIGEDDPVRRHETLKTIANDEEYSLSTAPTIGTSAVFGSRLVLHWIGAYSVSQTDSEYYELVDASLWNFINRVTPSQVAELMGIPDPDPPYPAEEAQPEPTSSNSVSQDTGLKKEGEEDHVK